MHYKLKERMKDSKTIGRPKTVVFRKPSISAKRLKKAAVLEKSPVARYIDPRFLNPYDRENNLISGWLIYLGVDFDRGDLLLVKSKLPRGTGSGSNLDKSELAGLEEEITSFLYEMFKGPLPDPESKKIETDRFIFNTDKLSTLDINNLFTGLTKYRMDSCNREWLLWLQEESINKDQTIINSVKKKTTTKKVKRNSEQPVRPLVYGSARPFNGEEINDKKTKGMGGVRVSSSPDTEEFSWYTMDRTRNAPVEEAEQRDPEPPTNSVKSTSSPITYRESTAHKAYLDQISTDIAYELYQQHIYDNAPTPKSVVEKLKENIYLNSYKMDVRNKEKR